jgi:hypothetical protein
MVILLSKGPILFEEEPLKESDAARDDIKDMAGLARCILVLSSRASHLLL